MLLRSAGIDARTRGSALGTPLSSGHALQARPKTRSHNVTVNKYDAILEAPVNLLFVAAANEMSRGNKRAP